jgi:hypothetical protein
MHGSGHRALGHPLPHLHLRSTHPLHCSSGPLLGSGSPALGGPSISPHDQARRPIHSLTLAVIRNTSWRRKRPSPLPPVAGFSQAHVPRASPQRSPLVTPCPGPNVWAQNQLNMAQNGLPWGSLPFHYHLHTSERATDSDADHPWPWHRAKGVGTRCHPSCGPISFSKWGVWRH